MRAFISRDNVGMVQKIIFSQRFCAGNIGGGDSVCQGDSGSGKSALSVPRNYDKTNSLPQDWSSLKQSTMKRFTIWEVLSAMLDRLRANATWISTQCLPTFITTCDLLNRQINVFHLPNYSPSYLFEYYCGDPRHSSSPMSMKRNFSVNKKFKVHAIR